MNVLVIGGTGVISTAIVERLLACKHSVTIFNRGLHPVRLSGDVACIRGDKKNSKEFSDTLKNHSWDAVIDMISYNPADAEATVAACTRDGRNPHFIFTSTVAVYKRPYRGIPIRETHALFDTDIFPYGFEKARMEAYLQGETAKGRRITIIRPSLTYGIGCRNIGVMRNNYGIVRRIMDGKPIVVFGDGTNPWEWTFAPDLAKAYSGVIGKPHCEGQIYHATGGDHHIWDDLYLTFGKIIGKKPELVHISTDLLMDAAPDVFLHVHQEKMHCGIFDNSKIKNDVPEYIPEYTLEKILRAMCAWYEKDDAARIVDEKLDMLEDSIIGKYKQCSSIMKGGNF